MSEPLLEPRIIRMPDLVSGPWLNTNHPISAQQLRGKVVLVDFWDYTCVNCLRTLPYLREWHQRYHLVGLTIIGIHSPEFRFAQFNSQVERAIEEFGVPYPVLLDNGYENWDRFANKAWPTKHLIDSDGYIRLRHQGEGRYQSFEAAIQELLEQRRPGLRLPPPLEPLREEDGAGALCYRPTPEIYAGYRTGGLFAGGLGNEEGYATQGPVFYELPPAESRYEGHFYMGGVWRAWPESVSFAGQDDGRVIVVYRAAGVNMVAAPSADPVTTELGLAVSQRDPVITVRQDGRFLPEALCGADIARQPDGRTLVIVDRSKMYELVRNTTFGTHELELTFEASGLALYTFTFTGCLADPSDEEPQQETYIVK